ncbi:alginate export family protein [Ulvibacterium sp.]|uniref:alginate export family protein n=1 Tax=Ulvibacterium sp. TaxID=2665914 RepID=UPI0026315EE5|nr:alginate export family protein [Ulvibacterium sp.]
MKKWHFIVLFLVVEFAARGQRENLDFSLLRQNDDVSTWQEKQDKNLYEGMKWVDLGENRSLSFGGSYRFQIEAFVNEQFSREEDQTDVWFLNRFMLHSHLRLGNHVELFAELNSSTIASKRNLSPVDRDELSMNQFFATYEWNDSWSLRVGRQNLRLGSGRLVDIREGPNVRLSFDMASLDFDNGKTAVKTFFGLPVQQRPGVFDNDFLAFTEQFGGLYVTRTWGADFNFDVYVLYKREDAKTWNLGIADDRRTSLGFRQAGKWKNWRFNNEFVYQLGGFGNQDIRAWTASFNIEKSIQWFDLDLDLGLKTEVISGDNDPNDDTLNTFDALYPRGAYFGRVARFGPSNLIDIHPYLSGNFGKFSMELDYVAFWRFSRQDGVYGPALNLQYPSVNEERFIGHQIGTITGFRFTANFALELETNLIFPGAFLKASNLDDLLFHTVLTAEFKF